MTHRRVELERDRPLLLEAHCEINYVCTSGADRQQPYKRFRDEWLRTGQPAEFLSAMVRSLEDSRTLAEVVEDPEGTPVAYLWMSFTDVQGYDLVVAEINDLWVARDRRQHGLGRHLMEYMVTDAARKGAHRLRSGTGADNRPALRLHESTGFAPHRVEFERLLP